MLSLFIRNVIKLFFSPYYIANVVRILCLRADIAHLLYGSKVILNVPPNPQIPYLLFSRTGCTVW